MQAQEISYSTEQAEVKDTALSNRISVISKTDEFFALREQWNEINHSSPKGTIFVSWEWLYTWWETYREDGNRETDGSYVFGEYMDLIIQAGQEQRVIDSFSSFLTKNNNLWDGMKFHELLDRSYLSMLFSSELKDQSFNIDRTVAAQGFRTYIDLPETYKDYLMGLRKKMRNNITRTFTRLESEQEYTIDTISDIEDVNESIEILADLNRSRRGDMKKYSVFEQENFVKFHR
ncbi:hypothetical protein GQR58_006750 [Nymphon striatum]|nr:hypothetical protein GQR58_006750 [Nymphon striatum]